MPVCCVVYGFSNRSGREKNKRFYRVPKVVVHKAEQFKKLGKNGFQTYICGREQQSRLMQCLQRPLHQRVP
ncbi:hypothetical protein KUCAC02_016528 [Chaenocephalus aceratus]|nr:hypothetical protein KUCAC02_016528 [Chaenocephalus aceratus]